ncbi:MAG: 3-dehydroquinate synthase [Chlamydiales bacterium]|nr:3-dehydroquinate synthase [Chlamydiales bacterium]
MIVCHVKAALSSYEIEIKRESDLNAVKGLGSKFVIVTDNLVAITHGKSIQQKLMSMGLEVELLSFPAGEENKTRQTKELLENQMFEKDLGRDTCLIALGGGVVSDIGGFLAATYCRGIPFVIMPTTLLGMVDASIGGKSGVNVPYGKNLVGAICSPNRVIIQLSFLKTLPLVQLRSGVVEMIKHGLIANKEHFLDLQKSSKEVLECDLDVLERIIPASIAIKVEIVERDAKEGGIRNLLNFGHTVGHALELITKFSISHGEAVAIGILTESYLSMQLGMMQKGTFDMIRAIFKQYGLPLWLPKKYDCMEVLNAMILDKKSLKGKPRFTLLKEVAEPLSASGAYCSSVDELVLKKTIEWMIDDLCCY